MRGRLRKTHILAASAVIAIAVVFSFFFFNPTPTGQSILTLDGDLVNGQLGDGKLNILISGGELIPTDTKIIIENNESTYEYILKDILPNKEIQGEYYLEGTTLVGEGSGFGKIGKIIQTPEISFEFEIIGKNESTSVTSGNSNIGTNNTNNSEQTNEEVLGIDEESTTEENDTKTPSEENITQESNNTEINPEENVTQIVGETTEESTNESKANSEDENSETTVNIPTEEIPGDETQLANSGEPIVEETTTQTEESSGEPVAEVITEEPTPTEEPSQEPTTDETVQSEQSSEPTESPSIVDVVTETVAGFFLPLTGRVTDEGSVISGTVRKGEDFVYAGLSGKEIRIVPGSVMVNEEEKSEDLLEYSIDQEGNLIVKTDYSITQEGFGPKYKTNEVEKISIDLTKLNLSLKEGPIKIKLVYNDSEYFSIENELTQSFIDELNQNETVENKTNITIIPNDKFNFNLSLTDTEKELIRNNVGFPVVSTEVKETESRYTAEFTLGDYSALYTYPKTLSEDNLAKNIERDRILWLKDITTSLNKKRFENTTTLTNLSQDYPVF